MKRQAYYPTSTPEQVVWLENFRSKLGNYTTDLGLTAGEVTAAVADARWVAYILVSWLPAVRAWSQSCTDAAKEAQSPVGSTLMVLPTFTPPELPDGVAAVNKGALDRIFTLVQVLKEAPGYTLAIGIDLGVVGPQETPPDFATLQPAIQALISGNTVLIKWGWGGNAAFLDMCQIQVDRGSGWTLLAFDTTPNYTDTAAFPDNPTKWKYRAIYYADDTQVGVWSSEASVIVGG